jgi:hypothetical protein
MADDGAVGVGVLERKGWSTHFSDHYSDTIDDGRTATTARHSSLTHKTKDRRP